MNTSTRHEYINPAGPHFMLMDYDYQMLMDYMMPGLHALAVVNSTEIRCVLYENQ